MITAGSSLAEHIAANSIDIKDYLTMAGQLADLLRAMDPESRGSIFCSFCDRIAPRSIRQVPLLRMECKNLPAHLKVFHQLRINTRQLKVVQ